MEVTKPLVEKFMEICEEENIPFHLKYAIKPHQRDDGIVIGSETPFFKKHIEILRRIAIENPDLLKECGTPHLLSAKLDGWLGLADECTTKQLTSYTQNILDLFDISFKRFLIQNPEISEELGCFEKLLYYKKDYENELNKQKNTMKETDSLEKIEKNCNKYLSDRLCLKNIKSKPLYHTICLIDDKKEEELYNIFLNECKQDLLDIDNPAFKKDTRTKLLSIDEDKSANGLTQEYVIKIAKEIEVAREKYNAQLEMNRLFPKPRRRKTMYD